MSNLQFLYGRQSAADEPRTPLTHHDVLQLVAPFSRAGRQVDLEASDRARRRVVFQVIEHAAGEGMPPLTEHLALEVPEDLSDRATLTRALRYAGATGDMTATLEASGPDVTRLLAWVDAVPLGAHWQLIEGVWLARSYRIRSASGREGETGPAPHFMSAEARFDAGLVLQVEHTIIGSPLEARLRALHDDEQLVLPEDFLAVAGRSWRPLRKSQHKGWRGSLKAPNREPERTPAVEGALEEVVRHLVDAVSTGPQRYHERFKRARWRAAFQRAMPLLVVLAFLIATPSLMFLPTRDNPAFLVVVFQLPTLMLIAFFSLRELPLLEVPPLPAPLSQTAWSQPVASSKGRS